MKIAHAILSGPFFDPRSDWRFYSKNQILIQKAFNLVLSNETKNQMTPINVTNQCFKLKYIKTYALKTRKVFLLVIRYIFEHQFEYDFQRKNEIILRKLSWGRFNIGLHWTFLFTWDVKLIYHNVIGKQVLVLFWSGF